jgi:predicted Fe-Mo cluster-binding NifX family protein
MAKNETVQNRRTMTLKVLIPVHKNDVAPRFDLAAEVIIATIGSNAASWEERDVVLPRASADKLCHLAIAENVNIVICGGIEDTYYQYLTWKNIEVIDSVIGTSTRILNRFRKGTLAPGEIV